jgi:hypothetical protein
VYRIGNILRPRFASTGEIIQLFLVCILPIHLWSWLSVLREVPGYIFRLKLWDIVGIIAYTQVYSLMESILVMVFIIGLAFLLPRRWLLDKFVAQGAILSLGFSLWMIPVHYQTRIVTAFSFNVATYIIFVWVWIISFLAVIGGFSLILSRHDKFEGKILTFVDRLIVLSATFLFLDLIGLLFLFIRNWT